MATKKIISEEVTITLRRSEAAELLAVLRHAEGVVSMLKPRPKQHFLGGLIKKVTKAVGKVP